TEALRTFIVRSVAVFRVTTEEIGQCSWSVACPSICPCEVHQPTVVITCNLDCPVRCTRDFALGAPDLTGLESVGLGVPFFFEALDVPRPIIVAGIGSLV